MITNTTLDKYKKDVYDKLYASAYKDFANTPDTKAMLLLKAKLSEHAVPFDLCNEVASKTTVVVSEAIAEDWEFVDSVIDLLAKYISNYYKFTIKHDMSSQIFLNLVDGMSLMLIPPDTDEPM